jgi:hypothetical protein
MEGRFPQERKEEEDEGLFIIEMKGWESFFSTEMKGWGKVSLEHK